MKSVDIERAGDAGEIGTLLRRAFHTQPGVADMVVAIRASAQYEPELALVARRAGRVAGFVMISHATLVPDVRSRDLGSHDARSHDVLTLSPLATDPDHERTGIGSDLVRAVLSLADARRDLPRIVTLEGDPRFYGRLGFEFAPDHGITFDLPDWAPREAAQVHRLSGYDPAVRGHVRYPPAFALAG